MIDLKFEVYNGLPCVTKTFEINGVRASVTDFGDYVQIPTDSGYSCKSMTFNIDSYNILMAMDKYKISENEFYAIGEFLTSIFDLSDGCNWCKYNVER